MSEALDNFIRTISHSTHLTRKEKLAMIAAGQEIALQGWRDGVQKGYEKLLQDYRDGGVELATATRAQVDEAIARAQAGDLMPGEFFS